MASTGKSEDFVTLANRAWQTAEADTACEVDESTLFAIIDLVDQAHGGRISVIKLDCPKNGLLFQEVVWHRFDVSRRFTSITTRSLAPSLRRIINLLLSA